MTVTRRTQRASRGEAGLAGPMEIMMLLVFALVAMVFLGYLGRLNSASTNMTGTARTAARAASLAATPDDARQAAETAVARAGLGGSCLGPPTVEVTWVPSPFGSWFGGSVTVRVSCTVANQSLAGVLIPGNRAISVADTEVVDAFQAVTT